MRRHHSRLLVAALALSLLTACSAAKDTGGSAAGRATDTKPSAKPTATDDSATNGATKMGIEHVDISKPIFTQEFVHPGKPQRKVTVGILSLERKDKVAILKVVVTPHFADQMEGLPIRFNDALGAHPLWWEPSLLDLKNLRRYKIVTGGGFLSYDGASAENGKPMYGWAGFAAPPANVTTIDLAVTSWMPRFLNVPIR